MPVFYYMNQSFPFPDHYREWSMIMERDVARMGIRIRSEAVDTSGQRHGCESFVDEYYMRDGYDEAINYFRYALERHFRVIDDYCRDLAIRDIHLRPRPFSGGTVRAAPSLVGEDSYLRGGFVGIDLARGPDVTAWVSRRSIPSVTVQQTVDNFEAIFPSEFHPIQKEPEPEKPQPKAKRKMLEAKPPADNPATLAVGAKPRKLRLKK